MEIDNNFYWLSLKKDVLDYEAARELPWAYYTPTKSFADYTALDKLPKVKPEFNCSYSSEGEFGKIVLKIKNPSSSVAFFTFLDLIDGEKDLPILPVYWNDNYISLLPEEERTLEARFYLSDASSAKPKITARGWNVDFTEISY